MAQDSKSEAVILRKKAEELLKKKTSKSRAQLSEAEMQKLIHELEVHQIELEMQNDELVQAKEQAEFSFQKLIELKDSVNERLLASETRYRRLFESAKDGILILDAETGMISDVNPFLIEMLRYSKDQMLNKAIWEIGIFKDIVANHEKYLELQQKEYVRYDDLPLEAADGRKISVEFVSNVYLVDHKKVIQCNIREITTQKKTEMALRMSETHLRTLVQSIPDLIWLKDPDGVFLSCNPMFERLYGAKEVDMVGKTDYDFVDHELADFFRENDRKAIAAGKPITNEEWATFANDGRRVYLETIKTPMFDSEGKLIGVLGTGRDITGRKLTEERLRESEERFRAVFDQAPIAIALIDMQGHPIISNFPLSKMLGYSSDELTKMKFTDFTHPEDIDSDVNQFNDLLAGKLSGYNMEKRYIHKNGDLIWANLFVTTLSDNNGMPGQIIGMVEDITGRKQAEKEIAMLAHSLKSINECVSITDLNNKIIFVNESFLKTYGYEINELLGNNIDMVRSQSNEQNEVARILPNTIQGEWQGELLNRRKDGKEFPIYLSTTVIKDKENRILGLIGVATDISERKQAEEKLLKLSSAIEQTVNSILITDREGTIEYVNHAFEVLTGYSAEEALGKTPRILKSGTKDQEYFDELWKTILSGKVFKEEVVNKKKNGDLYDEEKTISPIFDQNKNITHFVGIGVDITERKHAEMELLEAKNKAEESDRLKSAFLANMSHEVRTPLNSIIGFSELLADPDFDGEQKDEFIQHIIANGNNLLTIISDIMDISKLESGEITIRKSKINARAFIENTIDKLSFLTQGTNLELRLNVPENSDEAIIFVDAERLNQIFNNLISNSFKFTTNGQIEIGYQPKGKMIEFFVKDTGMGIAEEFHTKIFDRFRQVDNSTTRKFGGNGLGLAISKKLVELMGGKIWVKSESGNGATFYFTIPTFSNNSIQPNRKYEGANI